LGGKEIPCGRNSHIRGKLLEHKCYYEVPH